MRKTYFLSPSWNIQPTEVALGSVIASLDTPHRGLSDGDLPSAIDTTIYIGEEKNNFSTAKSSKGWSAGLFSTFLQIVTLGGEVSHSSSSSSEVTYSCEVMETKRFTPSPAYIAAVAKDPAVRTQLEIGGIGAKVFVITGIKTVKGVNITTIEQTKQHSTIQVGAEFPGTQLAIGPKVTSNRNIHQTHTKAVSGPIVFAFEVEKLRMNRKGQVKSTEFVRGAMLGQKDEIECVLESVANDLNEKELGDFEMEACLGIDDETGTECQIVMSNSD
ncbi:hypothetical protein BGAL_0429g00040 [Botrytis galanthina]|uniref:Uncharacterized protein n=1 Tax=Botrytis galanthina TaxID=278940 RepID=A0A4S8QWL6_9HELO|nr:hypothetical protein BGAL_0429g00040 [Botrytis galanthina]